MTSRLYELLASRDKLLAALGRSERLIEFEGRKTEFRSPDELLVAMQAIDGEIAALTECQESRVFVMASSGGYYSGNGCCGGGDSFEVWR